MIFRRVFFALCVMTATALFLDLPTSEWSPVGVAAGQQIVKPQAIVFPSPCPTGPFTCAAGGGGGASANYPGAATPTPFPAPTNGVSLTVDPNNNLNSNVRVLPVNSYFVITTNTAVTIKNGKGILSGVMNLSDAQQPAGNCSLYDSLTATGTPIFSENGIYQDQQWSAPFLGIQFNTGLTELCAVAPTIGLRVDYQ